MIKMDAWTQFAASFRAFAPGLDLSDHAEAAARYADLLMARWQQRAAFVESQEMTAAPALGAAAPAAPTAPRNVLQALRCALVALDQIKLKLGEKAASTIGYTALSDVVEQLDVALGDLVRAGKVDEAYGEVVKQMGG